MPTTVCLLPSMISLFIGGAAPVDGSGLLKSIIPSKLMAVSELMISWSLSQGFSGASDMMEAEWVLVFQERLTGKTVGSYISPISSVCGVF